jgi:hypothetical protein
MVHRCKIQYKILLDLLLHRAVNHLRQVVNLLLLDQNRHQAVHLPEKVLHRRLLIIQQVLHQQINLLHKVVAVVSPKQVKLKQPVIVTAKQVLV